MDRKRDAAASADSPPAKLTPVSAIHADLVSLPPPKGKIVAAVYGFRDQTGQYKPSPDSSFSTAVTQGATSLLVKAMLDSNWFVPVEREGLQDVLTERRIVRALETQQSNSANLAGLVPASILLEGGIIAYETNVRTGGAGARFLGVGASEEYRTDQVTINLRAVDIRTGRILVSNSTTKGIYSYKLGADIFRYVSYQRLLEVEVGYTRNEPAQLCVQEAIETALVYLIAQGLTENQWSLKNADDLQSSVLKPYFVAQAANLGKPLFDEVAAGVAKSAKANVVVTPEPRVAPSTAAPVEAKPAQSPTKSAQTSLPIDDKSAGQNVPRAEPDNTSDHGAAIKVSHEVPASASSAAATTTRQYMLQLGVFDSPTNAKQLRAKLTHHGISSQSEMRDPIGPKHKRKQLVTVGPFQTRQEVAVMRQKLATIGVEPGIVLAIGN